MTGKPEQPDRYCIHVDRDLTLFIERNLAGKKIKLDRFIDLAVFVED